MQDIFKLVDCVVEQEFTKERVRGSGRRRLVDHGPCIIIDDDDDDAVGGSKEGPLPSTASGASGVQNGEPRSNQQTAVGQEELPITTGNGSRFNSVSNGSQTLGPPPPLIRTQTNGYFTNGEGLCNGSNALEPPPPVMNGTKQANGHSFLSGGRCVVGEGVCNGNGSVAFGLEDALWGNEETTLWPSRHATAGLGRDYRRNSISSRTPANGSAREWRRSFLLDALALKLRNKQCRIYQLFCLKKFFFAVTNLLFYFVIL